MITNGFTYIAVLVALAGLLVMAEEKTKGKLFAYLPPVVLLYLLAMILCTLGLWDLKATKPVYGALKNNLLYAMVFLMLLRCDIRQVLRLGPKLLACFFTATLTIMIAFVVSYAVMRSYLGEGAWRALAALCGSWIGGSGNMIAMQAAFHVPEGPMGYALVVDSINYAIWVMFLLWAVNLAPKFNLWTHANTAALEETIDKLDEARQRVSTVTFPHLLFLLGLGLVVSFGAQIIGNNLNGYFPIFDKATWTILAITIVGPLCAMTPLGRIGGSAMLANVLLYTVIALLASRASFLELEDAPFWILTGFLILAIHGILMVGAAKAFKFDLFTSALASLANIGGTASAPILAGTYHQALVPVGVLMALLGYIIGNLGALIVGNIMALMG